MKISRFLFFIYIMFLTQFTFSQVDNIQIFKNSNLVVILESNQKLLNNFLSINDSSSYILLKNRYDEENIEILSAFQTYNFSHTVFLYRDDLDKLIKLELDSIKIYDNNLNLLTKTTFDTTFYIASFGYTKEEDNKPINPGLEGLLIYNNKMKLPKRPINIFIMKNILFKKRSKTEMVEILQRKLQKIKN